MPIGRPRPEASQRIGAGTAAKAAKKARTSRRFSAGKSAPCILKITERRTGGLR